MSQSVADQLFLAYMGRAADTQWRSATSTLTDNQGNVPSAALLTAFYNTAVAEGVYSTSDSPSTLVNKIFLNIFGFAASSFEQTAWGNLIANGTLTAQSAAWNIFASYLGATNVPASYQTPAQSKLIAINAFSNALTDPTINAAYSQLNSTSASAGRTYLTGVTTQATAATAVTNVSTTVASLTGANSGTTFTITSGIDSFTGTSGNDTVQGAEANLGALDSFNGGAGTDSIVLALTSAANTLSSAQFSNFETLSINQATNDGTVTLSGLTGITTVTNNGSVKALTVSGVAAVGAVNVTNVTTAGANTTITYADAAVTGTADVATLTVSGVTSALQVNLNSATGDASGLETINVVSSGTANSITLTTNDTSVKTINISGSTNITIADGTNLTTTATTINASAATGNVTITGIGAAVHTVTGGTGNDIFTFDGNFVGNENATASSRDTVNGGAGRDTLAVTSAVAKAITAVTQLTATNMEILRVTDANANGDNIDITKIAGVDTLQFNNAAVGASTFTVASTNTVEFITGTAGNNARSYVVGGTGTTDVLNLKLAGATDLGNAAQTFTGVETLNINTGTTAGTAAIFGGTLVITPSAGVTNGTIVATGTNALTLTGNVTAGSIDASALGGALTVSGTAANGITITGSSKGDTLNGSAAADLITGGNGADTITGRAGNDTIALAETTPAVDTVVFSASTTNGADTITGFQAGNTTTSDKLNVVAMTAGAITAGTLLSSAAAADATTNRKDFLQIFNTDGTAASITTGGTKTLAAADFTAATLTNVAAFIAEKYTGNSSTTDADTGVYAINYTASGSTTTYIYQWDNDTTANVTQAGELALVGTVTRDVTLVNADFVIA